MKGDQGACRCIYLLGVVREQSRKEAVRIKAMAWRFLEAGC